MTPAPMTGLDETSAEYVRNRLVEQAMTCCITPWDTQEFEDAFNAFCATAESALALVDRVDEWEAWNLKATSTEIMEKAFELLGIEVVLPPQVD
jgi:hypothetical protein